MKITLNGKDITDIGDDTKQPIHEAFAVITGIASMALALIGKLLDHYTLIDHDTYLILLLASTITGTISMGIVLVKKAVQLSKKEK